MTCYVFSMHRYVCYALCAFPCLDVCDSIVKLLYCVWPGEIEFLRESITEEHLKAADQ